MNVWWRGTLTEPNSGQVVRGFVLLFGRRILLRRAIRSMEVRARRRHRHGGALDGAMVL